MKTLAFTALLFVSAALLLGFCGKNPEPGNNLNANAVAANENRTVLTSPANPQIDERTRQALLTALADERRAQAVYQAVLAEFGDVRPFARIVNAEKRHESFLLPLFEKYGVKVPENEFAKEKAHAPATLAEACQNAVSGEKDNIAIYDGFLEFVKEPDIREVFTLLRAASKENHLPAFERCAQGGGRSF